MDKHVGWVELLRNPSWAVPAANRRWVSPALNPSYTASGSKNTSPSCGRSLALPSDRVLIHHCGSAALVEVELATTMPQVLLWVCESHKTRSDSREKSETIAPQLGRADVFCRILVIGIIYLCLRDCGRRAGTI